jgi:hypothetical protein
MLGTRTVASVDSGWFQFQALDLPQYDHVAQYGDGGIAADEHQRAVEGTGCLQDEADDDGVVMDEILPNMLNRPPLRPAISFGATSDTAPGRVSRCPCRKMPAP